jgi:putative hydrolase of the HAD superfamily
MRHAEIDACLFDIGNVLLPFDYARTWRAISKFCAVSPQERLVEIGNLTIEHECGRLRGAEFFDAIQVLLDYSGDRALLVDAWSDIFYVNTPMVEFASHLLSQGMPCHLLSNIGDVHAEYIRGKYPFIAGFSGRVYSFEAGVMKPDPAIFDAAIQQLRFDPARILYIDDKPENVEGGRLAGLRAVSYELGAHEDFLHEIPLEFLPEPAPVR